MSDHVPASLYFSEITYTLGGRTFLDSISGCVKPGQVMAIMGASGAGKSTFLDILARKRKRGTVSGTTLVNGREVSDAEFKKVIGFVDQEDTLMSTLTVYETVLYSALLRLPREMSIEAKKFRTLETMKELGILGIKDMRIGDSGWFSPLQFLRCFLIRYPRSSIHFWWRETPCLNCLRTCNVPINTFFGRTHKWPGCIQRV
jgi:ABC-type phosphate/phosphonate transport system ATPase subunit